MNEVVREFLLETHENLAQLDLDLVALEKTPTERETLARAFRTLHTVKGTAGFLGLEKLQGVAHAAESLLSKLRDGELLFNPAIATALLAVVDAIRRMLTALEACGDEGEADWDELIQTLDLLRNSPGARRDAAERAAAAQEVRSAAAAPAAVAAPPPEVRAPAPPPNRPAPPPPPAPVASPPSIVASPPSIVMGPQSLVLSAAEVGAAEGAEAKPQAVSDSTIRVDVGLLEKLMTLVGELVLARNQIMQFSTSQGDSPFLGTVQRLNVLTTELQANVMKTRMLPINNIWSKFPRVVRDLAVACGKQVRVEMEGQGTELDRTIIEAIRDPLTHLIRNAVDHGIEPPAERQKKGKLPQGRLTLHAFHEGGKVIIEITDDGGGIDPERVKAKALQVKLLLPEQAERMTAADLINLVFLPGFSTADKITHFSGRGVGMDVVRANVERIGGTVNIESRPGRGTTVKMKIPLTLAIIPALTISSGGDRYAIPQVNLLELVRLEADHAGRGIEYIQGTPVYRLRGNLLPVVYLNRELDVEDVAAADGAINIVVLQADDRQFGLVVDAIHDTEEIVVKPLQQQLKGIGAFAGATIMGDGKVALILDVVGLAQRANVVSGARERALAAEQAAAAEPAAEHQALLLFSTRDGGRLAMPLAQVARLEEFPRAALERVGNQDVIQYRGELLPLIDVTEALRPRRRPPARRTGPAAANGDPAHAAAAAAGDNDPVHVVVYAGGAQRVGLIVGRILDAVEEAIITRAQPSRPGVLFNSVVQGRATEFLDVEAILRTAARRGRSPRAAALEV
jgi:two-component system chemotaxis sensor kinase CheA